MKKDVKCENNLIKLIIKTVLIESVSSVIFISLFALVMYFLELDKSYSVIFATISIAISCMLTSFLISNDIGEKGYITGTIIGFATFILITIISLVIDKGSVTLNTLFHFIIIQLSAMIGGIIGVNKKGKKYI